MDMLSTALNRIFGLINASVEDSVGLLNAIKSGSLDVDGLEKWYRKRRAQSLETLDEIGDQVQELRRQAMRSAGMEKRRRRRRGLQARRRSGLRRRTARASR